MTKTDYTDTRIKQLSKAVTKLMRNNDEFYNEITELKSRVKELEDEDKIPLKRYNKLFIQSNGFLDELLSQLRLTNSENKHLKEKIRELEDELDIHQHHIAELESEEGE